MTVMKHSYKGESNRFIGNRNLTDKQTNHNNLKTI